MKLYAPKYYKTFRCIADKCEHSCCIGWEIDIDDTTLKKYQKQTNGYGLSIANSISMQDTPHFQLDAKDRCPHLDACGLCKIILHLGEEYLCDICREHPRFYNFTNVAEVGIGMSCPEAARVILSSPDYAVMEEIGEVESEPDPIAFDGRTLREEIYEILQTTTGSFEDVLDKIYSLYDIEIEEDSQWLERLASLEYLKEEHKHTFMNYSSEYRIRKKDTAEYGKRFLAYLVYRHCTEAIDGTDFRSRLAFCLFCVRLLVSLICMEAAESLHAIAALASILSEEIEYSDENTWALMP